MNKKVIIGILVALLAAISAVAVWSVVSPSEDTGDFDSNSGSSVTAIEDELIKAEDPDDEEEVAPEPVVTTVSFGESNLEPLPRGRYELWGNVDGKIQSITRFTKLSELQDVELPGEVVISDLSVSIEPGTGTSTTSSGVVVAERAGAGRLSFQAVDLSTASGEYITGTPSNDPEGFENSGLWFARPGNPPSASLSLPNIDNTNWIYEGWAVHKGTALTTGMFKDVASGDNFSGYNGPGGIPNLPGEDFLQNLPGGITPPIDLGDGSSKAVVTLEPFLDGEDPTGSAPFQIKFLVADIPLGIVDHTLQPLTLDTSSLPYLDVEIK